MKYRITVDFETQEATLSPEELCREFNLEEGIDTLCPDSVKELVEDSWAHIGVDVNVCVVEVD